MAFSHKHLSALVLTTSLLAMSAPAYAQLDEIIVTAQKKVQNLQDVPIAIAAFDIEAIENNRIEGLEDVAQFTPGVYITPNPADNNGLRVNIRGVATFDPQVGQDSRVAIYQDGVYLGRTQGLALNSPDLARVEIVKGPQGTLYGRNTVAGAVNIISAAPDPSGYSGKVSGEYGNFDSKKLAAAINIPMGDIAALRLSGSYTDEGGWVKNTGPGVDFGGGDQYGFRGAFGIELSSDFRLDMAADYTQSSRQPIFYQAVDGFGSDTSFFGAAVATSGGRQDEVSTFVQNEEGDLEAKGVSIKGTWDINENHEFKAIAAYREIDSTRFVNLLPTLNPAIFNGILNADLDPRPANFFSVNVALATAPFVVGFLPNTSVRADYSDQIPGPASAGLFISPPGGGVSLDAHQQFSLEGTFNGSFADGKLDYTAGFFYFDEETGNGPTAINDGDGTPILQLLPILGQLQNPVALAGTLGSARQASNASIRIETEAVAAYAQLTYHLTDDFRLTGGLRYSDESKDGNQQPVSAFFADNIDLLGNLIQPNIATVKTDKLDVAAIAEYDVAEDVMLYASYKTAYRAGGFNATAIAPRIMGETYGADFIFGREDLTAYEAGIKSTFGGNIRLNAAGFYYDFKDQQTTTGTDPLIATLRKVVNTDEEVWGFEVDGQYAVNDNLTLNASYSFIDGDAGDVINGVTNQLQVRDELQGTPKNSFLVGFDYNQPLSSGKSLFANANYSYKDDVLSIPENALRLTTRNLVNGRIGLNFETDKGNDAYIALYGQNLLDDKYTIDSLPFETFARRTVVYGQPRTYGVMAGYKF